ncbi:Hypothetical predicted protein [Podarcis lilfordi]|uniref:Uncharacterized protein n=1 Tax=Podarcis lilfordi TaxID=74358 RepID=A0AA35NTG1_9SAUR|nr:Hypothetical predicted protein [Podarcis lilfordi]
MFVEEGSRLYPQRKKRCSGTGRSTEAKKQAQSDVSLVYQKMALMNKCSLKPYLVSAWVVEQTGSGVELHLAKFNAELLIAEIAEQIKRS